MLNVPSIPPRVCVIVLNYRGQDHLAYCLPSLLRSEYENWELVCVDNASRDGSVEYVRRKFPQATLLVSQTNLGWSGGNNLGIRYALNNNACYIALVNNDILVHPRWLMEAVRVCESDPLIGMVGFRLFDTGRPEAKTHFEKAVQSWNRLEYHPTDNIRGCALFVRDQVFHQIGLFDESYFAYAEENDLEFRARHTGYKLVETNMPVWHYAGGSFQRIPLQAGYLAMRGQIRFAIKHLPFRTNCHNLLGLIKLTCWPTVDPETAHPAVRRLHPSNPLVNGWLLLRALAWNVLRLPQTFRRRAEDRRRIEAARRLLSQQSPSSQANSHACVDCQS